MPATEPVDPAAGWRIDALDPDTASDAELHAVHRLDVAVEGDARPDEPVPPPAHSLAGYRHTPAYRRRRWWVARAGDEVVGRAECAWNDLPQNRDHAWVDLKVAPAQRRRGIGSALMVRVLGAAGDFGASLLDAEVRVGGPGEPFLTGLGGECRLVERRSACRVERLDRALLEGWVGRAGERAGGYRLLSWDGPCPDDLLGPFCELIAVMNTAPMGDLEWEDDVFTPERWRASEAAYEARGYDRWTLCARHDGSGELAGYTELHFPRLWPELAYQEDTGVWPRHRNRGLGRWLKAAMALRVLDERPVVQRIETWNAHSNEAMLSINESMGFAAVECWGDWQVDVEGARRALARFTSPTGGARSGS